MAEDRTVPAGPGIEDAIRQLLPAPVVLGEAGALDRELVAERPAWDFLLHALESFPRYYPALLLSAPEAVRVLGRGCVRALCHAPAATFRTRAARAAVGLLSALGKEAARQGAAHTPVELPLVLGDILRALAAEQNLVVDRAALMPPLLAFGRQVVMVAEEGIPPEAWYELLAGLTSLLLTLARRRVSGEPVYDGRWDETGLGAELAVELLAPVRGPAVSADRDWLDGLGRELDEGRRPPAEVFLELADWERRDQREAAWQLWFDELARRAGDGRLGAQGLAALIDALAAWLLGVEDRRFLAALAAALRRSANAVLAGAGEESARWALARVAAAIAERLKRDAGRGESDAAAAGLRETAALLVELRLAQGGDADERAAALQQVLAIRTGPLLGQAVSCDDLRWRLKLAVEFPEAAGCMIHSLLVAFAVEHTVLGESACGAPPAAEALSELLIRSWPAPLGHRVRAVLRLAPLSPLAVAGPSARGTLMALQGGRGLAYLGDLRKRVLDRSGADNLLDVERVLRFWASGRTDTLADLAEPDSLAALPAAARTHLQLRQLLDRLASHTGGPRPGVRWLARLSPALVEEGSLRKVAGFEGLESEALRLLSGLLRLHRMLVERYDPPARQACRVGDDEAELFRKADSLLEQRREIGAAGPGREPFERLERLDRDLGLGRELDAVLEQLACRHLNKEPSERPRDAAAVLARLLEQLVLGGLDEKRLPMLAAALRAAPDAAVVAGLAVSVVEHSLELRRALLGALRSHVLDSLNRLQQNPLAEPTPALRPWFERHGWDDVEGLVKMLADDLLSVDGDLLLTERLARSLSR